MCWVFPEIGRYNCKTECGAVWFDPWRECCSRKVFDRRVIIYDLPTTLGLITVRAKWNQFIITELMEVYVRLGFQDTYAVTRVQCG